MKKSCKQGVRCLLTFFLLLGMLPSWAEEKDPEYITVSGVVKDARTKQKLSFASIYVLGSSVGTVANADGAFSIKVNNILEADTIVISYIGYTSYALPIGKNDLTGVDILLEKRSILLDEAIVSYVDPLVILKEAMKRREDNYPETSNLLNGFYRETIQKRRTFISVSEAVVDVFKTPYKESIEDDYVQIYKGRQLMSQRASDTLLVKLLGGPHLSIFVDVAKNPEFTLNSDMYTDYKYQMEIPVSIEDRPQFVISFKPQIELPYALNYGKYYIDQETYTFSRAEIYLSMEDINKASQAILRKKPAGLRFKPEEVSYVITYREENGRSYLYYVRNEVHFRCDWKRKLFSTNYRIVSEMVTTDRREFNKVFRLKVSDYQQIFRPNQIFSDEVHHFFDENYWKGYNIIEPTESLDVGIKRLIRRQN